MKCIADFVRLLLVAAYRRERWWLRQMGETYGLPRRRGESLTWWRLRMNILIRAPIRSLRLCDVAELVSIATGVEPELVTVQRGQPGTIGVRIAGATAAIVETARLALLEQLPVGVAVDVTGTTEAGDAGTTS